MLYPSHYGSALLPYLVRVWMSHSDKKKNLEFSEITCVMELFYVIVMSSDCCLVVDVCSFGDELLHC